MGTTLPGQRVSLLPTSLRAGEVPSEILMEPMTVPGGSWSKMTNPKNSKQTRRLRWRRWRPNRRNGALAAQADRHLWTPWKTSFSGPLLGIPLGMTDDLAKCRRASWLYSWRIIEAVRQCYRLGKPTPGLSPRGRARSAGSSPVWRDGSRVC